MSQPTDAVHPSAESKAKEDDDVVIVDKVETSLEWVLSSPPPQHQFEESPIIVEIGHLFEDEDVGH